MDTSKMKALIVAMTAERDALTKAIGALMNVVSNGVPIEAVTTKEKRRGWTAASRKKQSEGMKAAHARRKAAGLPWAPGWKAPIAAVAPAESVAEELVAQS